jgi:hypothetical protein
VLAFVGNIAARPSLAVAAPADDSDAPAPAAAPPAQPAPAPYPQGAAPPPPYPAPYGQYPPPGYAPYPYQPYAQYPPPQLTKVHKVRRGLVTGGAVTFGVSWGIAATISFVLSTETCSSTSCNNTADYLWIPIAGPLIVASEESGSGDSPGIFYLWSAAQAAGLAMLIVGLVGHDVMEYRVAKNGPALHLGPLLARDANGLTLTARW